MMASFQKDDYIKLFNSFNDLTVLIIGDVMVDSYLWGGVERISPEAPVPIVSVKKRENRLGGAANVALNIKSLGANPILFSVIGNDQKGNEFIKLLEDQQMDSSGIILSSERITTTKFRVIGNKVQLLRVDEEMDSNLNEKDKQSVINRFNDLIDNNKIDVIIFQDYDKGLISREIIELVTSRAIKMGIPVSVDPKRKNFSTYENVTLFKPNLKELKEGMNVEFDALDMDALKSSVNQLKTKLSAEMILLTLSENGVYIDYDQGKENQNLILPSHVRNISDVSGAGDTVISVASLCLAKRTDPSVLAAISNLAGGQVCEKVGVVPVDKDRLLEEAIKLF